MSFIKKIIQKIFTKKDTTPPPVIAAPGSTAPDTVSVVDLKWGKVQLPARGRFVVESHYATKSDSFGSDYAGRPQLYPTNSTQHINDHVTRSAALFFKNFPELAKQFVNQSAFISRVYDVTYEKQWTPANDGGTNFFGQGARGNVKPTADEEMWQANMMFAKLPSPGTKFILHNPKNGKNCVVQMGYEIGPGTRTYLGGAVPEVHWYLESGNTTELEIRPVSQGAALGPMTDSPIAKPVENPVEVVGNSLPTREEVNQFVQSLLVNKYNGLKETNGKNRSPNIDAIIKRQGGAMGEPYCMYGCQDILDAIRERFNVTIDLPEGGSTQSFWEGVKKIYKTQTPASLCIGIFRKGETWQGHAVWANGIGANSVFPTFEFNTNLGATMLERDGEGCGFRSRNVKGYIGYSLRGFVDVYAAMKAKA